MALYGRASVYLQMRQPREAVAAFDEALKRSPHDVAALRGKATALEAEGHAAEAAPLVRRADELERMARAGGGPGRDDEALRQLEALIGEAAAARAAGDMGRAAGAYHAAAVGYARNGHVAAALDACLRALEARPGAIDVHFLMAQLYLRSGWRDLGVQRVQLIDRRLDVDADPRRRSALRALAHDHRTLCPELEQLAAGAPA